MARLRHLAILTEDVERLVKFYTNSFGLKIVKGVGTATYLTDGHINLAIIPIGPERKIEGNHLKEGINHFGFEVESVDAMVPVCRESGAHRPRLKKDHPTGRRNTGFMIPMEIQSTCPSMGGRIRKKNQ
jgi:catechol 2,3-dioxygenase-like lactoylglutathione lyase family enzyme